MSIRRIIFMPLGHLFLGGFVIFACTGVALACVSDWFYRRAALASDKGGANS